MRKTNVSRRTRGIAVATITATTLALSSGVQAQDAGPGEQRKITAANAGELEGLLPDGLLPFTKDYADLDMTIVPTEDYRPNQAYVDATVKYACQATIDEKGVLQNYTAGQPFPYSEWAKEATGHKCDLAPDDPQFALKLAWNVNYRWQGPGLNVPHFGFSYMRNAGKERWRLAQGEYRRTYFSHRADIEGHTLEEGTDVEWAEFFDVKTPFDLKGTKFLLYRYTTDREDDTFTYLPALRRVRRVAATQKADSLLGTEFTLEDFYLFAGYVWDHEWEFKGEDQYLATLNSDRTCFPSNMGGDIATQVEGVRQLGSDEQWDACKFGPYNAMNMVNEKWQRRTIVRLDDIPTQEGHPYSRKAIYYDKETLHPVYGIAYDRAGEPFRVATIIYKWSEDSPIEANNGQRVLNVAHATIVNVQNENSHVLQVDSSNAAEFSVAESRRYYDTTRLKRGN